MDRLREACEWARSQGQGRHPWELVNCRWLLIDYVTGEVLKERAIQEGNPYDRDMPTITDQMRTEANARRHAGAVNSARLVNVVEAELPPLKEGPVDYRSWEEIDAANDARPRPIPRVTIEWREGKWFEMNSKGLNGQRVYTQNEKYEAIAMFNNGYSSSIVAEKFDTKAATVRQWAKRDREQDSNANFDRFTA